LSVVRTEPGQAVPSRDVDASQGAGRVRPLDGLRALAIGAVIAYHAGVPGFVGGSHGVTVFFVLSGFLITGVLMKDGRLSGQGLSRFYLRRTLRLAPALMVLTAATALYTYTFATGLTAAVTRTEIWTTLTYTTNFYLGRGRTTENFGLLGHTWSLAVEEQYYLIWPVLLLGLVIRLRSRGPRVGNPMVGVAVLAAWTARLKVEGLDARVGMSFDSHASCLLIGSALALTEVHRRPVTRRTDTWLTAAAGVGLVVILVLFSGLMLPPVPYGLDYIVIGFASAAVIARLAVPTRASTGAALIKVFGLRPVVWVGVVSYSLYLWHPLVFAIAKEHLDMTSSSVRMMAAPPLLVAVFAMSAASYYWVEKPFLRLKERFEPAERPPVR
jgi:peptidoglycan/LPS O-acetylase OafA/YrhL